MTRDEALAALGLSEGASRAEITAAHRELAQMLHPDRYGSNKRLQARAEQQMKRINEAREVLLGGAGRQGGRRAARARTPSGGTSTAEDIRFEAEARARAAETARLSVAAQARTMRERRRSMGGMVAVAALAMLLCSRMRGTVGTLVFSVASMLVVWGIVDVVSLSGQIATLQRRAAELLSQRDAARRIAEEAARL